MKPFSNLFTAALCLCMGAVFAQEPVTIGQTWAMDDVASGLDSTAQSFTLNETATLSSLRAAVVARYDTADHPGMLTIIEGFDPHGPNILLQQPVMVPGLNKFYGNLNGLLVNEVEQRWIDLQGTIADSTNDFSDIATEFPVSITLPAGMYTFIVSLDTGVTLNDFGYNYISAFTNCHMWYCSPQVFDPYEAAGQHFIGLNLANHPFERDMAFQVEYFPELSTSVEEPTPELLVNGIVAEAWDGAQLRLFDEIGRLTLSKQLDAGERLEIPTGQVYIARLSRNDQPLAVKKILVSL